jgi:hypothetical protein
LSRVRLIKKAGANPAPPGIYHRIAQKVKRMELRHLITKLLDIGAGIYDPLLRMTVDEQRFF